MKSRSNSSRGGRGQGAVRYSRRHQNLAGDQFPLQRVGKLTLNRNPDNFYAETEEVAFHLGRLVPGIDVTDDPLLQGRLSSYLDT